MAGSSQHPAQVPPAAISEPTKHNSWRPGDRNKHPSYGQCCPRCSLHFPAEEQGEKPVSAVGTLEMLLTRRGHRAALLPVDQVEFQSCRGEMASHSCTVCGALLASLSGEMIGCHWHSLTFQKADTSKHPERSSADTKSSPGLPLLSTGHVSKSFP